MKRLVNSDVVLGIGCMLFALLLLLVWIPADTETATVEWVRGRQAIGDAMAPTIVGVVLLIAGLLLTVDSSLRGSGARLSMANLSYLVRLVPILVISLFLMRWTGPVVVEAARELGAEMKGYRELRDTMPWKYLGYLVGGTFLVTALISLVERRLRWHHIVTGFITALVFALIYDLPFRSLVLPPNGDV